MFSEQRPDERRGGLPTLAVVVLVVSSSSLAVAGALVAAPADAATATTDLALDPGSRTVAEGDSVTYDVTLGTVSGGVGSYDLTVALDDTSTARITGVTNTIGGESQSNVDDGAADVSVFAGDTVDSGSDVAILRVTVTGEAAGNASLSVEPRSVSDESGDQYGIAGTSGADLTVERATVEGGTDLSLAPGEQSVGPTESATYDVTVGAVSGGVGSYNLTVALEDTSTARITGVADATGGTARTSVGNATASIDVSGGDTVDRGTDVTVARVTVTGEAAGTATLSLDQRFVRNETGAGYAIDATNGATLAVETDDEGGGSGGGNTTLSFDPLEREVAPGESATYDLVVGTVSDGVGSYNLNVSLDDGSVARIAGVTDATGGVVRKTVGDTEAQVGAFAGDTVDSGSDVAIVRVTVTGEGAGNASLSVEPRSISDENGGDQYTVTSTTDADLTVRTQRPPDVVGEGNRATDPDGDGRYEDVNGDGDATPGDASVLFNAVFENNAAVTDNVDLFDFSGDGSVTTGDASVLFEEVF